MTVSYTHLDVYKRQDLDDDVDIIGATDWTWTLDDVGYPTGSKVSSLNPGEYTIKEVNKDNYHHFHLHSF